MAWYSGVSDWLFGSKPKPEDYTGAHAGQITDAINQGLASVPGRAAPQLATGPQDQFRAHQLGQLGQLGGIASGQQQGAGELAVQRQMQNALAGQQALARMRGAGGGGMLAAARQSAALGSSAAGMGQQAALQDQMGAHQLMSGIAGQGRGQDIGIANSNAQLAQQQTGMNDQALLAYLAQLQGLDAQQLQARLAQQQANPGHLGALLGAGAQIGGALLASDERLKTDVSPAAEEVDAMLDALKPYRYRYKDEAQHGAGPRAGIMAQDLERSEAGRRVVTDTPDGKMLDVNKALSAALAGVARVNERLRAVEAKS